MSDAIAPQDAQAAWKEVADERAGKPVKAVTPPPEAKSATPAAAETEPTEPEWKKHIADLESKIDGRMRKAEGHLGHLIGSQKEIKELLSASQAAKQQVGGDSPTQAEVKQAASDPTEWADLKAQYPEWATATEKFFESRQSPAFDVKAFEADLEARLEGKSKAMAEKIIDSALSVISPGWKKTVNSEEFQNWLGAQPDDIREIFNSSDDVGESARVLKLYDAAKQASPSNAITEQRKATLAAATAAPRGPQSKAVSKSYEDMTPAERWEHEKRIRAKQRQ